MSDIPFEDPTAPQPVPIPETTPTPAAALPKAKNVTLTATYTRLTQPEPYNTKTVSYIMEAEFGPLTSDQADLLLSNMTTLLKMRAGLELGIESEINDHGVLQEIAKVFPGTRQASVPQAPAPRQGRAQAPAPEADAGPFDGPAEYAPAQNQAPLPDESNHPENAIWKAFFDDASRFYNDIDSDHPRIKHKQSGDTGWLNAAPEWVVQQLGVPRPAPPQNRGGGRGNGGGGYGGGNNRGGGGGGYQGSRTGGGGGGYRGGGGGGNRY